MTNYSIKPTIKDDLAALCTILDTTELFPSEMLPDMIEDYLAGDAPDAVWLTAREDETVAGFCYAVPEQMAEGAWNMLAIAVDPSRQGTGIGGALTRALETELRTRGARIVIADTSGHAGFAATRGFYAAKGYSQEARIRDFWGAGDDKVTYWKSLSAG